MGPLTLPSPIGIDSDCLIYLTEWSASDRQRFLVAEGIGSSAVTALCSTATAAEVLVGLAKGDGAAAIGARDALEALPGFSFLPLTMDIALEAARIRA